MPEQFLSQDEIKKLPKHSHKHSLLWQFLHATKPGDGEMGDLIRKLRDRRDMARSYAHKTALRNYLHHCKVPSSIVAIHGPRLYDMYREWVVQQTHPRDDTVVEFLDPKLLAKSGLTRYDLALLVLQGHGNLSKPAENLKAGGSLADLAFYTADLIIDAINMKANKQNGQKSKTTAQLIEEREAAEGFKMGGYK